MISGVYSTCLEKHFPLSNGFWSCLLLLSLQKLLKKNHINLLQRIWNGNVLTLQRATSSFVTGRKTVHRHRWRPASWSLWSRQKYLDSCEVFYLRDSCCLCLNKWNWGKGSKRETSSFTFCLFLWGLMSALRSHVFPTLSNLPPLIILMSPYVIFEFSPVLLELISHWMQFLKYLWNHAYFVQPASSHHHHHLHHVNSTCLQYFMFWNILLLNTME